MTGFNAWVIIAMASVWIVLVLLITKMDFNAAALETVKQDCCKCLK